MRVIDVKMWKIIIWRDIYGHSHRCSQKNLKKTKGMRVRYVMMYNITIAIRKWGGKITGSDGIVKLNVSNINIIRLA